MNNTITKSTLQKEATEEAYNEIEGEIRRAAERHDKVANQIASFIQSGHAYESKLPQVVDKHRQIAELQRNVIRAVKQMKADALCDL